MREGMEREIRRVQEETAGVRFKGLVLCEGLESEIRRVQEETDGLGVQRIECNSRESGEEGLQNARGDQGSRSLITECHRQPYV